MAPEVPCLSLAIAPLKTTGHYAVQVTHAPYVGGYVLNECVWTEQLTQTWQPWQDLFAGRGLPSVPHVSQVAGPPAQLPDAAEDQLPSDQPTSLAGRLMQNLGIALWAWLFEGAIKGCLNQSVGIAMGQQNALRLRLEIRDPDMIALPWEIMQDGPGKQAMSLSQQIWFSRTTSDVHPLPELRTDRTLEILLVLGHDTDPTKNSQDNSHLALAKEAEALATLLREASSSNGPQAARCQVHVLVQPTPAQLTEALESHPYNVFFYAGHGAPGPDGGLLFLGPARTMNGTELAQVLTRCQVKLAVFNACWGALPDQYTDRDSTTATPATPTSQSIPRSSLAEVLIHHGVPAVLGMRDSITDEEALSFIQVFAKTLAEQLPVDQAVAIARQHLLTLYKFNQQAWTLPVLYMHPEFAGELLKPEDRTNLTQLPSSPTRVHHQIPKASLRSLDSARVWQIHGGVMRVGRDKFENDLVLQDTQSGVSRQHAMIFCRQTPSETNTDTLYFLRDYSRFGTWVLSTDGWQKIQGIEIPLHSGTQLRFGSSHNETMEFIVHTLTDQ